MRTKNSRTNAGASAVEFGLVLPILLMILLGLIDYGWVFFVRLNMTNAAREGARVGVTHEEADALTEAQKAARGYLQAANLSLSNYEADPSWETISSGERAVKVTVRTINQFYPLVGFVPTPTKMEVSAQMRWELAGTN